MTGNPSGGCRPRILTFPPAFLGIGALGFFCEAAVLSLVVSYLDLGPVLGRAISFPTAVTLTWALNRKFVFLSPRALTPAAEYAGYFAIQVVGAAINLGVYLSCLWLWPLLGTLPVLPLAIGSGIAMSFNFTMMRLFLYRRDAVAVPAHGCDRDASRGVAASPRDMAADTRLDEHSGRTDGSGQAAGP